MEEKQKMADWNELKHDIEKAASGVGKELTRLGNSAARSLKLNGLKVELAELYEKLGRASYKKLKGEEEESAADIAHLLDKIDRKLREIEALESDKAEK